jgi:CarboxypepD_reg-like domain
VNQLKFISIRSILCFFIFCIFFFSCAHYSISIVEEVSDPTLNNTCTIWGYISDRDTKEHLIGARVLFNDGLYETSNDVNGFFSFENIPPGSYKITAQYIGYKTYSKSNVKFKGNYKYQLNIELPYESDW